MKKLKSKKCIATNIRPVKKKAKVNNLNHPFFSIVREYIYKKNKVKKTSSLSALKSFFSSYSLDV